MNLHRFKTSLLAVSLLTSLGAFAQTPVTSQVTFDVQGQQQTKVEDAKWLSISNWPQASLIQTSKKDGLQILDAQQRILQKVDGRFGALDYRLTPTHLIVHTVDLVRQQAVTLSFNLNQRKWDNTIYLPKTSFKIENVCLFQDDQKQLFSFLVGEQGKGEQWLIGQNLKPMLTPKRMRSLNFPVNSKFCFVEDQQHALFVNEENVGVWQYSAEPEAPFSRHIVDLVQPYGTIQGTPHAIVQLGRSLWIVDGKSPYIYQYQNDGKLWKQNKQIETNLVKPEQMGLKVESNKVIALVNDNHQLKHALIDQTPPQAQPSVPASDVVIVQPTVQTVPVPSAGDAADDPAIWHNRANPEQSRILGTDKQGGLQVYDLKGKQTQYLAVGRLNNVDVRPDFNWKGKMIDLAIATNRDANSLHLFAIQKKTGVVSEIGQLPTSLKDIYGFCMYKDRQGEIYAIPNDKDGTFIQYHIQGQSTLKATEVKRFAVKTQPEGCVVDDAHEQIFLGEEDHAVWQLSLDPKQKAEMQAVIRVGEHGLKDDIEGMALYHGKTKDYLVISSQGNDSYVVVDAQAPYQYRGRFKIGINVAQDIDAVTETDGLDVTSQNLGGVWKKGMLVVQDGHKVMPEDHQNFKYIPWTDIANALKLED